MRVLPYQTLAGEVTFRVTAVRQDRTNLETSVFSSQERVVALHQVERDDWETARLSITATLSAQELSNGPWNDVVVIAVLTEKATNSRTTTLLERESDEGRTWAGQLRFWRSAYRSQAELSVMVVATVEGVVGRVIGQSEDNWLVDLTARRPVRRNELLVSEGDFRDGPHEWLRPFKDSPWLIETSGDMPTVHLNTGFEGIAELLNSSGSPMEKAVRDMLAAQIATDVWTAVFHSAVSDLELDAEGNPQWPGGWRDAVLRGMLADVLPDQSGTDALREIHARRSESMGWNELQPRINYAAARRAKVARNLGTAIRVLETSQKGSKA
ncbi:hypothetical protein OH805_23435 [Streptomyces sp. NBC_00879]|uniref:hypothetical protein n=1 Tax=Streptomyces sp. NBC_00879 TaxID=2975855 RepID=UPI00386739F4|nr:hypothetical protein OH805_23435 [Streptomyces sp. NBC_00879]